MKIIETSIQDVLIFEPDILGDSRGYFFESFRMDVFEKHVGKVNFVQENQSKSSFAVLRGLHFQKPPFAQSKLVRCLSGEVLDVAVDIRLDSPTYGKHVSAILNEENQRQLWIPKGFAHGFVVLSENAVFHYKCDEYYAPEFDAGIVWNEPEVNIDWVLPVDKLQLSNKDKQQASLKEAVWFNISEFNTSKLYRK